MLTEVCGYLKNWFDTDEYHKKLPRLEGEFTITGGKLAELGELLIKGQCFYIYGSYLNDGAYIYTDDLTLNDEKFTGFVQSMHVDTDLLKIVKDMQDWQNKYGTVDGPAMSPFNSESFGGYSYSKSAGYSGAGAKNSSDPFSVFASRLSRWRKL